MNSPLSMMVNALRIIPWNRKYGTINTSWSCEDHVGMGHIFALLSIVLGQIYAPLFWLYLATWLYHCVLIEVILDTFIKKKNKHFYEVAAQCIERSAGHAIWWWLILL